MNTSHRVQTRKVREESPNLEQLDARIVPAAVHPGAEAAGGLAAGASVQASEATTDARGILRREIRLERLILRREVRVERLEAREARLEARHHRPAATANQGLSAASSTPATWGSVGPATPAASSVSGSQPSTISTGSPSVLSNPTTVAPSPIIVVPNPTTPVTTTGPLPANVAAALDSIYEEYENGTLPASQSGPGQIEIQGNDVGVTIKVNIPGDFAADVADAQSIGMQVNASSPATDSFAGFLPIVELAAVAQLADAPVIVPIYGPIMR